MDRLLGPESSELRHLGLSTQSQGLRKASDKDRASLLSLTHWKFLWCFGREPAEGIKTGDGPLGPALPWGMCTAVYGRDVRGIQD